MNHSYDQVIQARTTGKYIEKIIEMGNLRVSQEKIDAELRQNEKLDSELAKDRALLNKGQAYYIKLNGQRSSRVGWEDVTDLKVKGRLAAEAPHA